MLCSLINIDLAVWLYLFIQIIRKMDLRIFFMTILCLLSNIEFAQNICGNHASFASQKMV